MVSPIKVKDVVDNFEIDDFETVRKYEVVDAMWGMNHIGITDEDIKTLKEGKYLYRNDGEYALLISYIESEGKE